MARLTILVYPDPRLRCVAQRVQNYDAALAQLIDDMFETLYATQAIGLAATQVDQHVRLVVMDVSGDASAPLLFINPEILTRQAPGIVEESCLSVPGLIERVVRSTQVIVRARDRSGNTFESALEGLTAVCLQHEMDHLQGMLFIDRLSFFRRLRLRRRLLSKFIDRGSASASRGKTAVHRAR